MNPLHQYEAWLDTLDARFKTSGESIVYSFDQNHEFPLKQLQSEQGILQQAEILKSLVLVNSEGLPLEYMCKRLIRLSIKANNLDLNIDEILNGLKVKWGSFSK